MCIEMHVFVSVSSYQWAPRVPHMMHTDEMDSMGLMRGPCPTYPIIQRFWKGRQCAYVRVCLYVRCEGLAKHYACSHNMIVHM